MKFSEMAELEGKPELVGKAIKIAVALDDWIGETCESSHPCAYATVGPRVVQVCIGDVTVWCKEVNNEEELTLDMCKAMYLKEIAAQAEILKNLPAKERQRLLKMAEGHG